MLTRVRIQNFRSCSDVEICDLRPLTLLVGPNGAGKTNTLRAIELAARTAVTIKRIHLPKDCEVVFEFQLGGNEYRYRILRGPRSIMSTHDVNEWSEGSLQEDLWEGSEGDEWNPLIRRNGNKIQLWPGHRGIQIGHITPMLPAILSLVPHGPSISLVRKVVQFLQTVRYYPMDEPSEPEQGPDANTLIEEQDYQRWLSDRAGTPEQGFSVVMRLWEISKERPDEFDELKQLVGSDGLGIIEEIESIVFSDPPLAGIKFRPSPFPAESGKGSYWFKELSHGTRRILRILVSILYDQSTVILLEQPEDSVHPALLHKLIAVLRSHSDSSQFIVTSHSPMVFDLMSPDEIRLVTMQDGKTQVRSLAEEELVAAESFLRLEGSLSDFLETVQGG